VRAKLHLAEAVVAWTLRQNETVLAAADAALQLFQRADDRPGAAAAQILLGTGLIRDRRLVEGEGLVRAALALARAWGAEGLIALATHALALARLLDGDLAAARTLYREELTLFRTAGRDRSAAVLAQSVAEVEFRAGNIETALQLWREATEVLSANSNWASFPGWLSNGSAYLIALGRFEEARGYAREAVVLAREAGFEAQRGWALQHLAAIAVLRAGDCSAVRLVDLQRAASVLGFVNARMAERGQLREYTEQQEYDKMVPVLRNELGADLDALMNEGKRWSDDQAVAEALKIEAPDIGRPSTSSG
jgi:tetratricopeptide (TPR) repeat protein